MKTLIGIFFCGVLLFSAAINAQVAVDLGSLTTIASVCPTVGGTGSNTDPYMSYPFAGLCPTSTLRPWSSGALDTLRHRLILFIGGHSDYHGNEVYALYYGTNPPAMQRLFNPFPWCNVGFANSGGNAYCGSSTLSAAITTTTPATISVNDCSTFPAASSNYPNFVILIDSEQKLATNCTGGSMTIVTNGFNGSTAATHAINAQVVTPGVFYGSAPASSGGACAGTTNPWGCFVNIPSNTPAAAHAFGCAAYMPTQDAVFYIPGGFPSGTVRAYTWWMQFTGNGTGANATWVAKDPVPATGTPALGPISFSPDGSGYSCTYDSIDDTVIVSGESLNGIVWKYTPATNTYHLITQSANFTLGGMNAAFDPLHNYMWYMGANNVPGTAFKAGYLNMNSGSPTFTDLSSALSSSCGGMFTSTTAWPGWDWDPVVSKFQGYPSAGNVVYTFDPVAALSGSTACTSKTLAGYSIPAVPVIATPSGVLGKFRPAPDLPGKWPYVGGGGGTMDSVLMTVDTPVGLGKSFISSSGACLDVDGDGYGVGPACLGIDADDADPTVHTAAQAISKWSTLQGFLVYKNYQSASSPAPVYCISPTGSDSTGAKNTNADTACNSTPFQTWNKVYTLLEPAGVPAIVLFRAGTYTQQVAPRTSGSATQPLVLMGYPGEAAIIDYSGSVGDAVQVIGLSYTITSNLQITANASGAGWDGGTFILYQSGSQTITFVNNTLQFCEISGGGTDSNVDADNQINTTIQFNVVHDPATSGQHNVYLGSNTVPSTGVAVRYNMLYSVHTGGYPNLQFNGRCTNCYFEGNELWNADGQEIAWLNGVSQSYLRNNLAFNTGASTNAPSAYSFVLTNGNNTTQCMVPGDPSICSWDQTGNVIENNTFWSGTTTIDNSGSLSSPAVEIYNQQLVTGPCGNGGSPPCGNLGGNTWRNNLIVGSGPVNHTANTGYPPVTYVNSTPNYLALDTWKNNIFNSQDGSQFILGFGPGTSGYASFNCASFATKALSSTGCSTASPGWTNVSTTFYNSPQSFNFSLASGSAAIGAGTYPDPNLPVMDLTGTGRPSGVVSISLGALLPPGANPGGTGLFPLPTVINQ